jgi:DNA (cytosine-5)-methyltransferase 1
MHFYNDNDPSSAEWLRGLTKEGLIPDGEVDERSIGDLRASEVAGFTQCHFFAGICGWPYALELAGWPIDEPVWTASCPCQPFSCAGKRKGFDDARHLWPVFAKLVAECRPPVVFGEQVASPAGRDWYAGVRSDLEAMGYAVSAADLCAACVGSPTIRQRLFWVSYSQSERSRASREIQGESGRRQRPLGRTDARVAVRLGDSDCDGPSPRRRAIKAARHGSAALADGGGPQELGDASGAGLEERASDGGVRRPARRALEGQAAELRSLGPWSDFIIVRDNKGKLRRTPAEPAFFPLADGLPGRVAQLRGLGNAIVPQLAAVFIEEARAAFGDLARV